MSLHTFYLEPDKWCARPELSGAELAHMRVLRLQEGDEIYLLNGEGRQALCRVDSLGRKKAELTIENEKFFPEPASKPVLALALSKAVRRSFFMEKAAELGAWGVWLWQGARSQGKLNSAVAETCRAQLVSGMKQCKNPWLPRLWVARNLDSLAEMAKGARQKILPWEKVAGTPPITLAELGGDGETVYLIGPEGGFAEREVDFFRGAGFKTASLGERVLRCETAALLCLGLHWWASQLPE